MIRSGFLLLCADAGSLDTRAPSGDKIEDRLPPLPVFRTHGRCPRLETFWGVTGCCINGFDVLGFDVLSLLVPRCSAGVVGVILVAMMIFDVSATKNSDRRFKKKIELRPGRVLDTV